MISREEHDERRKKLMREWKYPWWEECTGWTVFLSIVAVAYVWHCGVDFFRWFEKPMYSPPRPKGLKPAKYWMPKNMRRKN
jgi:hypothetical protein